MDEDKTMYGNESGACVRCGRPALITLHCAKCFETVMCNLNQSELTAIGNDQYMLSTDMSVDAVVCSCGSRKLDAQYQPYCGSCKRLNDHTRIYPPYADIDRSE